MTSYEETCDFWTNTWDHTDYSTVLNEDGYKKNTQHIIEIVAPYLTEVKSFLELGVGNGRNIHYFHEIFPDWEYGGNDIYPLIAAEIDSCYPDVLEYASIVAVDTLSVLEKCKQFDMLFTHGHLMHIPDSAIKEVCGLMEQRANKFVCIYEAHSHTGNPTLRVPSDYRFERDYKKLFNLDIVLSGFAIHSIGTKQELILFKK